MISAQAAQPNPWMARFQHSFVGLCVALLLAGGLASVPTTCECGAGIAHGHSIFMLPGHHHGPDGSHADAGQPASDGQGHMLETASHSGPRLLGKIAHGSDRLSVALTVALTAADAWQRASYPATADRLGTGWSDAPEAPPPRERLHG